MSKNSPDREATFSYIDKVHAALDKSATAYNRAAFGVITLSLVQLCAALGWISTHTSITFIGLGIEASFVVFLVSSMVVVASLATYMSALLIRQRSLVREIFRLYKSIGFVKESEAMHDSLASPFRSVTFVGVLTAPGRSDKYPIPGIVRGKYLHYTSLILICVLYFIPPVAQFVTGSKVLNIALQTGWPRLWLLLVGLPIAILVLITAIAPYATTREMVLARDLAPKSSDKEGQSNSE